MGRLDCLQIKRQSSPFYQVSGLGDFMNNKLVLIILSIFLAPVAVFIKKGAGKDLVINIILCFLFYIPAIIHALWLVTK